MARRRLLDYYRQFEELPPEEDSRRLRAKRDEEKSRELARVDVLDLSLAEWHEPPDPEIVNAATFALRRAINRYPETGDTRALLAVAHHHGLPPARVALGHGAGQLLQGALREVAAGGEAVLPWPSWAALPALAARAGVNPVPVALGADGSVDLEALAAAIGAETRAVVICSPNDPTGALVAREDLRAFVAGLRPDISVLLDEALVEFAGDDASCAPLVGELPNLLVFRSFSKAWSVAGLRGGYVLGPESDQDVLGVLTPGQGVASPTQAAIAAALEDPARAAARLARRRAAVAAERARLAEALAGTPFAFAPSHTHHVWLRGEGMSAASLTHGLDEQKILVASGAAWGDDEHVRVTLRDRAATERLVAALAGLAG